MAIYARTPYQLAVLSSSDPETWTHLNALSKDHPGDPFPACPSSQSEQPSRPGIPGCHLARASCPAARSPRRRRSTGSTSPRRPSPSSGYDPHAPIQLFLLSFLCAPGRGRAFRSRAWPSIGFDLQRVKEVWSGDFSEEEPREDGVEETDEKTGEDRRVDAFRRGFYDDASELVLGIVAGSRREAGDDSL